MKTEATLEEHVEGLKDAIDAFERLPTLDQRDEEEKLYWLVGACQAVTLHGLIRLGKNWELTDADAS